jgi:hypothetical protein
MHGHHIRAANCVDRILDFVSGDLLAKASVTRPAISFDLLLARSCLPRARRSFFTPHRFFRAPPVASPQDGYLLWEQHLYLTNILISYQSTNVSTECPPSHTDYGKENLIYVLRTPDAMLAT